MSRSVLAVFPGTFDPITLGHEDMIRRAAGLFGQLVVAVAAGHHKKTLFTLDERMEMVRQVFSDVPNVTVHSFSALMRDFVVAHGAQVMVRGVRGTSDFDYEVQLAGMNRSLMPDVETVFMTPDARYQFISSTYVREIASLGGAVAQFVAPVVHERLLARVRERHAAG
ncbi:pantetheine-phosphate adenylyltransferase [Corticibacter populi]|uniref:Phosphopantetheine adenylyltransferase n=1 Tax=Corticibacter populi TaxID=1550736 RepID=A0A3M6R0M4_9BURK|nr:pantetheine-phosphate adenylyltransferase [Corticibacter populi]RMX08723.1 pantetheine-phosphate adenylyltransferase [Corticibacter populi]RZS36073.1 phosphopantetheine adenylyltransferase [Corticibacter populi]